MKQFLKVFRQIIVNILLLMIIGSCSPLNPVQPTQQTTEPIRQAKLHVEESIVKVIKGNDSASEVQYGGSANVWVNDKIEVGEGSRAILEFPGFLDVELYRKAQIRISDAKTESGGSISVGINQIQGHVGVSLNDLAHAQVTLETWNAVISTLENGTEFIVCAKPDVITCVEVLRGSAEVIAKGEKVTLKGGEASYIKIGEPPFSPICAPEIIFENWKISMRESADTPSVADVVNTLPQRPCKTQKNEMVEISAGTYQIGSERGDEFHSSPHPSLLDDFWIDTFEVTNIQYQNYMDETGSPPPEVWPANKWGHPVRGVTWDQASAYCDWANKRLPSEAEWEVAGRGNGPEAPLYPWGNDPQAGGEIAKLPLDDTYNAGAYSFNMSPFGVYDMAGNVWEWVGSPYESVQPGYQVLRGGRFGYIKDLTYREQVQPDDERYVLYAGFRCATNQMEDE